MEIGFATKSSFWTKAGDGDGVPAAYMPYFRVTSARVLDSGYTTYFEDQVATKANDIWSFNPVIYWPNKDNLLFMAYYWANEENQESAQVVFDETNATLSIQGYSIGEGSHDLMYADAVESNVETNNGRVHLNFHHALCKYSFKAQLKEDYTGDPINLKKIRVKTKAFGNLIVSSRKNQDGTYSTSAEWDYSSFGDKWLTVFESSSGLSISSTTPITIRVNDAVKEVMVMPSSDNELEITYSVGSDEPVVKTVSASSGNLIGRSYSFNLKLSAESTSSDNQTEGWVEPPAPEPPTPQPGTGDGGDQGGEGTGSGSVGGDGTPGGFVPDYKDDYIHGDENDSKSETIPVDIDALNRDPVRTLLKDRTFMFVYEAPNGQQYAIRNYSTESAGWGYKTYLDPVTITPESKESDFTDYTFTSIYYSEQSDFENWLPAGSDVHYYFNVISTNNVNVYKYLMLHGNDILLMDSRPTTGQVSYMTYENSHYIINFAQKWNNSQCWIQFEYNNGNLVSSVVTNKSQSNVKIYVFYSKSGG